MKKKKVTLAQPVVGISKWERIPNAVYVKKKSFRAARTFFLLGRARGTRPALGLAPDDPPASIDLIDLLICCPPKRLIIVGQQPGGACPHESTVPSQALILRRNNAFNCCRYCDSFFNHQPINLCGLSGVATLSAFRENLLQLCPYSIPSTPSTTTEKALRNTI